MIQYPKECDELVSYAFGAGFTAGALSFAVVFLLVAHWMGLP